VYVDILVPYKRAASSFAVADVQTPQSDLAHFVILVDAHDVLTRRSQHSQECKDPRRQCFGDS